MKQLGLAVVIVITCSFFGAAEWAGADETWWQTPLAPSSMHRGSAGRLAALPWLAAKALPVLGQPPRAPAPTVHSQQAGSFIVLVSVATDGTQGDDDSCRPRISADGRYVVFTSDASNLAPTDRYFGKNVFLRDLVGRTTQQVDVSSAGQGGDGVCWDCDISADGRYIVFDSDADELVQDVPGGNIFLYDRATGTIQCISLTSEGKPAPCCCSKARISADGQYVAFESTYDGMVPGDDNWSVDIFRTHTQSHAIVRVSKSFNGEDSNDRCQYPCISADGSVIAFQADASNLVPGDNNGKIDIFVYTGDPTKLVRISVGYDGSEANGDSRAPAISADGRYVAFTSEASNLVPGDTNGCADVFVYDLQTGQMERVSVASDGTEANMASGSPSLSADGRYVAFSSAADNLVAGDTNEYPDVFVVDRQTRKVTRVSIAHDGSQGNGWSIWPCITPDGRYVAFCSGASNLVPGDTNGKLDVFVVDTSRLPSGPKSPDFNDDGKIDEEDIAYFIEQWLKAVAGQQWDDRIDLSGNGVLDYQDVDLLIDALLASGG